VTETLRFEPQKQLETPLGAEKVPQVLGQPPLLGIFGAVASSTDLNTQDLIKELLDRVRSNPNDRGAWMDLAITYRQLGDHSHQVWAWSRAVQHRSLNRHCRKFGHLLRFKETPDNAVCLYCGETFALTQGG